MTVLNELLRGPVTHSTGERDGVEEMDCSEPKDCLASGWIGTARVQLMPSHGEARHKTLRALLSHRIRVCFVLGNWRNLGTASLC